MLITMESFFLLLSMLVAFLHGEAAWLCFLLTALGTIVVGAGCVYMSRRGEDKRMSKADNFLIVALSWIVFSAIGMIPYLCLMDIDVASAFFETMSGFTTTGATCIPNVERLPKSLLFWRAITQWVGGLGIVVFSFALIPVYEMKNTNLYSAEVTGLGLDRLRPKIGSTARRVLFIYLVLTAICTFLYWVGPMSLFDSVCHAFSTIATGGFSTHSTSIAFFRSSYVEYVASFFMVISSVNFSLYYYMSIRRGRVLFQNEEVRVFLTYIGVAVVAFVLLFYFAPVPESGRSALPNGFEESFRSALFHVSSVATSTGLSAQKFDFVAWGPSFWMPTVVIMAIGACAGSTAGGIKVIRIIICAKSLLNELILMLHPRAVLGVRVSKQIIPENKVRQALTFIFIYILLIVVAMTCHSLLGADFDTALGSSISMLSNVGPGLGATGPASTFAHVPAAGKWLMSAYMLIGRLEIFTVLFLLMPGYWKDRK